jgi:hypothetical protein
MIGYQVNLFRLRPFLCSLSGLRIDDDDDSDDDSDNNVLNFCCCGVVQLFQRLNVK